MSAADRLAEIRARDLKPGDVLLWTGDPRWDSVDGVKVIDRRKSDDTGWWMTDGTGLADYVWDGGSAWTTAASVLALSRRMADALDAVLALCDRYEHADKRHDPPSPQTVAAKVYDAIERALGEDA